MRERLLGGLSARREYGSVNFITNAGSALGGKTGFADAQRARVQAAWTNLACTDDLREAVALHRLDAMPFERC